VGLNARSSFDFALASPAFVLSVTNVKSKRERYAQDERK
jgi:hypothetical protein